jgi:hypothetical protein
VDQAPVPSSGMEPDLGLISLGWCFQVQMRLPDELVHFSLESKLGQDCSQRWSARVKEDPEYHQVAHHLIQSRVPPYSDAAQPLSDGSRSQSVGISLGPPNVGEYFDRQKTKQHLEVWKTQILFFMPAGSDVYLCLSPEQRIHRIFKRQCRASGYRNVLRLWCSNQRVRDLRLYRLIGLVVS